MALELKSQLLIAPTSIVLDRGTHFIQKLGKRQACEIPERGADNDALIERGF